MRRRNYGTVAVLAVALAGGTAWAVNRPLDTDPAPVDVLLERTADADVPEATPAPGSSVSFAAMPVEPRADWDLPVVMNDRVQYWIDFLEGRNRDHTQLWLEREGRYGGFIRSKLRERGMPEDLLYLGMIESGLSPRAYSHAHAAGLWQFISETGRRYGLEVSTYVDERRDPIAATDAALDYLSDLHDRFGSWYLAAAGYNSGENRVERILRQRAGGRTGDDGLFWIIDGYLPRETRDYVPLMLAAGHIGKNPAKYGFHEIVLQAPLSFDEVEVEGGIPLRVVAEAASVELDQVEDLNPHLVRGVTPPGRTWEVRVPGGKAGEVAANIARVQKDRQLATVAHRVSRGETLSHIARRYGVPVAAIRSANGNLHPRRLSVGQEVSVPMSGGVAAAPKAASWTTYRVRNGDTLWGIARRHGVSVNQIKGWNGIGSRIYPGQRLRLAA